MNGSVSIARCPVHGLHGARTACFECGGPVEQVEMIAVADLPPHIVLRTTQEISVLRIALRRLIRSVPLTQGATAANLLDKLDDLP